jgi:hypothetical protein
MHPDEKSHNPLMTEDGDFYVNLLNSIKNELEEISKNLLEKLFINFLKKYFEHFFRFELCSRISFKNQIFRSRRILEEI